MKSYLYFMVLSLACPGLARADAKERCTRDEISNPVHTEGRNRWALRCGYIFQDDYDYAQRKDLYWTFSHPENRNAPINEMEPCGAFVPFTPCPRGCFEASQLVQFGGESMTPREANAKSVSTITALSANASLGYLARSEEPIDYFVRGIEKGQLLRIYLGQGSRIEVTANHPMVDEKGLVIPATDVYRGMMLLSVDGPRAVKNVERFDYVGEVWNIRPVSDKPLANVNISQAILTGSVRFQNNWATEAGRLALRKNLNVDQMD